MEEKYKVVFIVGAGASRPFGLPTGAEFKAELESAISYFDGQLNGVPFLQLLEYANLNPQEAQKLIKSKYTLCADAIEKCNSEDALYLYVATIMKALGQLSRDFVLSGEVSIDAFVASRTPADEQLAKVLIAGVLAKGIRKYQDDFFARDRGSRKTSDPDSQWIEWVYRCARDPSTKRIPPGRIAFVTFNYDCILEKELAWLIAGGLRVPLHEGEAARASAVPIHHVYGKVDHVPLISAGDRPFGNLLLLDQASRGINLMRYTPSGVPDTDRGPIDGLIRNAERLIFLGFGFDEVNVNLLGLSEVWNHRMFEYREPKQLQTPDSMNRWIKGYGYASMMGMKRAERARVEDLLFSFLSPVPSDKVKKEECCKRNLGDANEGCLSFLRSCVQSKWFQS